MERLKSLSPYWSLSALAGALLAAVAIVGLATSARGSNVYERDLGWLTLGQSLLPAVLACGVVLAWALVAERRRATSRERRLADASVELMRKEVSLEKQAMTDPLTGLYNRRYLYERLGRELRRAQRYGRPLSLILLDLDHSGEKNDEHGNLSGDLALSRFARVLKECLREPDSACRYGGEEFALVLPETDLEQALAVAEKLRQRVKAIDFTSDLGDATTVSQGIASFPGADITNENDMIKKAEKALYEAKNGGRDRIESAVAVAPVTQGSTQAGGPLM